MSPAKKPAGGQIFWLDGAPLQDLPWLAEAGAQKYWINGTSVGLLWAGLRIPHEIRTTFPAGPRRETGTVRFWLDGLPFDGLQKSNNTPEGFEKFWLNGRTDIGLFPPPAQPGPMPAHCLAP